MNREVHVRFWERAEVKSLRANSTLPADLDHPTARPGDCVRTEFEPSLPDAAAVARPPQPNIPIAIAAATGRSPRARLSGGSALRRRHRQSRYRVRLCQECNKTAATITENTNACG